MKNKNGTLYRLKKARNEMWEEGSNNVTVQMLKECSTAVEPLLEVAECKEVAKVTLDAINGFKRNGRFTDIINRFDTLIAVVENLEGDDEEDLECEDDMQIIGEELKAAFNQIASVIGREMRVTRDEITKAVKENTPTCADKAKEIKGTPRKLLNKAKKMFVDWVTDYDNEDEN